MSEFETAHDRSQSDRRLPRIVVLAETVLGTVAGLILLAVVVLTTIDVVGRYLFAAPLGGAYETTQLAMAAIVFAALPLVTLRNEHITVGLFEGLMTGRIAALRDLAVSLVVILGSGFMAWRLWLLALRLGRYGDVTAAWSIPLAPVAGAGAVGLALAAFAAFFLVLDAIARLGRAPQP